MAEGVKCQNCGSHATVHLTQIVDNQVHKVDLCDACAKQKGVTDPEGFSLTELLSKTGIATSVEEDSPVCDQCGYTLNEFKRQGRLGCEKCYETFNEYIIPMLKNMHRSQQHLGKTPERALARASLEKRLSSLKSNLKTAIASEQYEEAARYRDEINALKTELKTNP